MKKAWVGIKSPAGFVGGYLSHSFERLTSEMHSPLCYSVSLSFVIDGSGTERYIALGQL